MRHLFLFIIFSSLLALLLVAIVYISDPYGLWGSRFYKPTQVALLDPRILHPLNVVKSDYDLVFLGSSRMREGFDTRRISEDNGRVYNAGFSGATAFELGELMQIMGDSGFNGTVIVGIDFFGTAPKRRLIGASINGPLSGGGVFLARLKTLWGKDNFEASLRNISYNKNKNLYIPDMSFSGSYKGGKSMQRFSEGLEQHFISYLSLFNPAQVKMDNDVVVSLENGARSLAKNGARVIWFITPTHASRIYLNKLAGLSSHYESLQRQLAAITYNIDREFPGKVSLWDVSDCGGALKENVPTDPNINMTYFFDSNHFTPAYGELLVNVFLHSKVYPSVPAKNLDVAVVKDTWKKNWDACRTDLEALTRKIVASKAEIRCRMNVQWCGALN